MMINMKQLYISLFFSLVAISLHAQCFENRHNTTWYNGWISCKESPSPNPARGVGHWIMYDLGHDYALGKSHWWNNNEPDALNNGVKTILVDVSDDGEKWTIWGSFDLNPANGKPTYEGEEGPDFGSVQARYLLLTAVDNYGGQCVGFSEMKINVDLLSKVKEEDHTCLSLNILPNPFKYNATLEITSTCGDATLSLYDAYGRELGSGLNISQSSSTSSHDLLGTNLTPGVYLLVLSDGINAVRKKVVKVE